jgi:hypothetical protein
MTDSATSDAGSFAADRQESGRSASTIGWVLFGIALAATFGGALALTKDPPAAERLRNPVAEHRADVKAAIASHAFSVDYLSFSQLHFP